MILLPITKRLYGGSDNLYWKVLECGEAVALLVGGDEQSGFVNIPSLTRYILSTITKYILHHYIFYKTYWLPRRLQLANGDLSTICWVHQSSPFAPGGILHILCLWYPHLCPWSPNQAKKHEKSFILRSSLFISLTCPANPRRSRRLGRWHGRRLWWGASTLCHDQRVLWLLSAGP